MELLGGYAIERRRLDEYLIPDFWHNLDIWLTCKKYGFPHSGDWANQPGLLVDMLQIFDNAETRLQNEEAAKVKSK